MYKCHSLDIGYGQWGTQQVAACAALRAINIYYPPKPYLTFPPHDDMMIIV
jgi:hypothetical protein